MKRLLIYLKDYKKECAMAPLFKMLEASFELIVPLVVAAIIDTGIGAGAGKAYIVKACLILFALAFVGLVCSVTAQFFSAKAAVGYATKLRHALFGHLQSLSYSEIDRIGTSTMITRMTSDVNQTQTGVNMVLRLFLRSPFVVFGAMIMAFTIDVKAAVSFVVAIILLLIVVGGITKISIPMMKQVQGRLDEVLLVARENLVGIRVLRAFCKEEEEVQRFAEKNAALTHYQNKAGSVSALMNPLTYIIINLAIVWLIYTGAVQVNHGVLTQGEVVALYNYMSQILVELIKLANLIITMNKALASANRIADVFAIETSMEWKESAAFGVQNASDEVDCPGQEESMVRFLHVGLTYAGGGEEALTDIDFTVKRGQTIGIIGGTGSGKSSLVNLIPRFYDATSGEVFVDGKNVRDYTQEELEKKIAVVPQRAVLFKGTIESNLRWGKEDATREEMELAVAAAQAEDVVKAKGGLSGEVAQNGKNLSGGQRQRLTIARALVKQAPILILDDSASALDMATDAKLRKAIRELSYRPTVFIVSQRTNAIMDADQIIVLDDGEIMGIGTHEQLLSECVVYKEIYESQFKKEVTA
nr:ABC transporter ATP-binding protein [Lachnospiraceae bacterium]